LKAYIILLVGIAAAAASGLFIHYTDLPPFTLAASRLVIASAVLLPVMLFVLLRQGRTIQLDDFKRALPGGVLLGLHLGTWNMGVDLTAVANATLIVNLNPVAMPFMMYFMARERITRGELIGTIVALSGVAILTVFTADFGSDTFKGDMICVGSMVLAVAYLAFGRFRAKGVNLWVYVVPVYMIAAVTNLVPALFEVGSIERIDQKDVISVLGLALVCTVIGHSSFNYGMVHLRSQVVSICNLGQFVVAATLEYLIYSRVPEARFYPSAALIVLGALLVVRSATPRVRKAIVESAGEAG
jgi:drug/metabolite transporter (DMT)-like permease